MFCSATLRRQFVRVVAISASVLMLLSAAAGTIPARAEGCGTGGTCPFVASHVTF